MDITHVLLVLITGFVAGIINTMAAGGSLLTLPLLIFLGLPAAVANGTNRVAIVAQSISATIYFYRKGHLEKGIGLILGIPACLGALIGANIAISISDHIFNDILAVMMIVTVIFITIKPKHDHSDRNIFEFSLLKKILGSFLFFIIGLYGGFIQVGAGFFIITSLTMLFGFSLTKSNSVKVFVGGIYIFVSLFVFIINNQVNWSLGMTLAIGNATGAWVGSRLAIKKGDKLIKIFLIVTVVIMSAQLLGINIF